CLLHTGLLRTSLATDGLAGSGLLRCGLASRCLLAADGLAGRSLLRRSLLLATVCLLRRCLLAAAGTHGQRLCARLFGGGGFFVAHLWKLLLVSSVAVARLTIGRICSRHCTSPAAAIEPCRQASFIGPAIQRGSSSSTRASAAHVRKR